MTKNISKIIIIFIISLCGGLLGSQIVWPSYQSANLPTSIIESKEIVIQENVALQDSVQKIQKSIVGVRTKTKEGKIIFGSGLVVTSDGLIITLSELVPLKGDFTFFINSKTPNWQILKRDVENNLILVKLDLNDLMTISFSNRDELKAGERVFIGGTIFDNNKPLVTINEGIIKFFNEEYIRTNMFEKKTLSGSALFNIKGELLGLNTIDDEERVTAIPINKIKDFLGY